jgi:hypothetical protein
VGPRAGLDTVVKRNIPKKRKFLPGDIKISGPVQAFGEERSQRIEGTREIGGFLNKGKCLQNLQNTIEERIVKIQVANNFNYSPLRFGFSSMKTYGEWWYSATNS